MKKKTKIYPWKMYFHVLLGMFFLLPTLLNAQNATLAQISGSRIITKKEITILVLSFIAPFSPFLPVFLVFIPFQNLR